MLVPDLFGKRRILATLLLALALALALATPAAVASPVAPAPVAAPAQADVLGMGVVAVSNPLAARVGAEVLAKGGNAMDAAAAIVFSLGVVEPMMTGLSATSYVMVRSGDTGEITVFECGEMAPAAATGDMFLGPDKKPIPMFERQTHGNAVGVPGMLRGVTMAHEKFGTMPFPEVVQPAIRLADEGISVNWFLARNIASGVEKLKVTPSGAAVFLPNGKPLAEGDILVQKDLAKTLRMVAEQGQDAMYRGEIGRAVVAAVRDKRGRMTVEDLANYEGKIREPIRATYRGYEVVSMPPPSSGGLVLAQILKLLEPYDLKAMGVNTPETLHLMIEAMHLAYSDRAKYIGDADAVKIPIQGMLNDEYLAQRRALIDMEKANADVKPGDPWPFEPGESPTEALSIGAEALEEEGHTTHFSVVDQWGNMVAYTTTNQAGWGSGIMVPGYGFMLNNMMTNFDPAPGGANEVAPRKRPITNMTPTMLLKDGKPFMVLGSPGGQRIMTHVLQTILNVIDHDIPVSQAVNEPRVFSSAYPNVELEAGIPVWVAKELEGRGHKPAYIARAGSVQAIVIDPVTRKLSGGADARSDGTVIFVPTTP